MALTDEDIAKIVSALKTSAHDALDCRFKNIAPGDLEEAVKFYKHMNKILEESSSTFRNTLIGIFVIALIGVLWLGLIGRIKIGLGGP